MSPQPHGLGRGLGALIPPATTMAPEGSEASGLAASVLSVPVSDIIPNPHQPRSAMPPETLSELAESIRQHGMIQPLIVTRSRPTDRAPYQIIAGERRWRAAQLAGLTTVPVIVKGATPQQLLELALVENIQRADLNPLEEAEAYRALMTDFALSQGEVAERVGRSRVAVVNTVRLLRLPDPVKVLLSQGSLSEGHARALLALPDDDLIVKAAQQVVVRDLTVRQTEELVRRLAAADKTPLLVPAETAPGDEPDTSHTRQLEDAFRNALGTKVSLSRGSRGGRLVITFYSEEELQAIYERIVGTA